MLFIKLAPDGNGSLRLLKPLTVIAECSFVWSQRGADQVTVQSSAKEEPIFKTVRAQIAKLNIQIISDRSQGSAQPVDIILLSDPLPVIAAVVFSGSRNYILNETLKISESRVSFFNQRIQI